MLLVIRKVCMNSAYPVPVCVKSWYIAPFPTAVDTNYIPLLAYSSIGAAITNASSHKMTNHVWYLFEKLVRMAIFDNPVWCETRDTILIAMVHVDGKTDPLKRVTLSDISFVKLEKKSVADFATKTTPVFFLQSSVSIITVGREPWLSDSRSCWPQCW